MKIIRILELSGPSIWTNRSTLEAWVDLGPYEERPSNLIPGFYERLVGWLPSLIEHRCSEGERGGFLSRLRDGTWLGHILEHVSLELQTLVYEPVGYGRARETTEHGVYRVVIACLEPALGRACLEVGVRLLMAAAESLPFDLASELERLRAVAESHGQATAPRLITAAARARGIPARRVPGTDLLLLGYGADQRRWRGADFDRSPAVGSAIADDIELCRQLLRQASIPVRVEDERRGARHDVFVVGGNVVGALCDVGSEAARFVERTHPEIAELGVLAARVLGLGVGTIQLDAVDVRLALAEQSVAVLRARSSVDLVACNASGANSAQVVAAALLAEMMPVEAPARFQLIAVSGTNGKTAVADNVQAQLSASGKRVGRADQHDGAGSPSSVERALMNPLFDAAVIEVSELGVLEHGLPFTYCDVAVVTNLGTGDHLGRRYLQELEFSKKAIRTPVDVVRPTGYAVLNADDPEVRGLARFCKGQVLFFCNDKPSAELWEELGEGVRVVYAQASRIVLATAAGAAAELGVLTARLGGGHNLSNHLAAAAAAYVLGLAPANAGVLPSTSDVQLARGASRVIVSNCRNVSALEANLTELGAHSNLRFILNVAEDWTERDAAAFGLRAASCRQLVLVAAQEHPGERQVSEWIAQAAARVHQQAVACFSDWSAALETQVEADSDASILVQTLDRRTSAEVAEWLARRFRYEVVVA